MSGEERRLRRGRVRAAAVLASAACLIGVGLADPLSARADNKHAAAVSEVTGGLNGPRQISAARGDLLVAESDSGQVASVDRRTGKTTVLVDGLFAPQGVAERAGKLYIATGEAAPDSDPSGGDASSGLMVAERGGEPSLFADLTAYELANNPDGQVQFGADGQPLDALSNPYFVLADRSSGGFLLVADAGANAVLAVDRKGNVSTFFVPPTVTTGACATAENNTVSGVGCDAVPTGLAYGPDGLLYVSALTAEMPGEGRVYVLDADGTLVRTLTGFSAPTGVAVDGRGTVYVSELLEGAPTSEEPPPGFDPSAIGQIVRVQSDGSRSTAQVTMPSGLLFAHGRLYSTGWAVASFLGISDAGQIVTVGSSAFTG